MKRMHCVFALPLLFAALQVHAADAVITIHVNSAPPLNGGEILVRTVDDPKAAERVVPIAAGEARVEARLTSVVALRARVPHFWSKEKIVVVTGSADIALQLLRTGVARGRATGDQLPSSIDITFEPVNAKSGDALSGTVSCPLAHDGKWTCELPEGVFDVRLHVAGFIPVFRTAIVVAEANDVQLGALALRRGASVAGRVRTGDGKPLTPSCRVRLTPRSAATNTDKAAHDEALLKFVVSPDPRGRFQFVDVPPGNYDLMVNQSGYAEVLRRRIPVVARTESILNEPITLERPKSAEIIVSPPTDPLGRPWMIRLFDADGGVTRVDELAVGATEAGHRRFGLLSLGRYFVTASSGEETWFGEERIIAADEEIVHIDVPETRLSGRVSLGERGLPAEITFSDKPTLVAITLRSNEEGEFAGVLPRHEAWEVKVSAPDAHVLRTFRKMAVDAKDTARMVIELGDTVVNGTVLNADGTLHGGGYVAGQDQESRQQTPVAADGTFKFAGFDGDVSLQATATGERTSDQVTVHVSSGAPVATAVLKLHPMTAIEGRLVSASGPVPGGRVFAWPANASAGSMIPESSDAAGEFRVRMLDASNDAFVTVMAPGYALWHGRLRVDERAEILLNQLGGTLKLRMPSDPSRGVPYVEFGGNAILYMLLVNWSTINGSPHGDPSTMTINEMPAGSYLVCLPTAEVTHAHFRQGLRAGARCTSGVLSPMGELVLDLAAQAP